LPVFQVFLNKKMDLRETIKLIYHKKWIIFWMTVLGAVLFFDLMVIQEPQYKASSRILVIQKQALGQDIYTISKSAQYLTKILKEGIYSDAFFKEIITSPYHVEVSDFSKLLKDRRQEWQKSVKITIIRDLGVMKINVFYPQKEKAEQINWAIVDVLEKNHQFYHGVGDNVEIKILDKPLVSEGPVSINLWIGAIFGGLLGFLIGVSWVLQKNQRNNYLSLEDTFNYEVSFLDRDKDSV